MALQNPLMANSTIRLSNVKDRRTEKRVEMKANRMLPALPVLPPLAPRREASYPLAVQAAPFTALRAMLVYDDEPRPHRVTPKCRLRTQVGSTNRWRLPATLGSDLLGINQAIRAIRQNVSQSVSQQKKTTEGTTVGKSRGSPKRSTPSLAPPAGPSEAASFSPASNRKSPGARRNAITPLAIQPFLYKTSKTDFKFGRHGNKVCTGVAETAPADVLLDCLGEVWELHRPFLQKSKVLSKLLKAADYEDERREDLESVRSNFVPLDASACVKLELQINNEPWITKKALAIALSKLYEQDMNFDTGSGTVDAAVVVGVLGAALTIEFDDLSRWCQNHMMEEINSATVCLFHQGAIRYRLPNLAMACERWLCLHLVPNLSRSIFIKHLQSSTLQLILKSTKLFVTTEWQVYKTLCIWLYLHLNPKQDILPAWTTIVSFFANYTGSDFIMPSPVKTITREAKSAHRLLPPDIASSLSSTRISSTPFLETEEGQIFTPLFQALRLHGITNAGNIQDVIQMNVIPQRWLLQTLHSHYKALQGRHSPPLLFSNPISDSIRIGFIINNHADVKENFLLHGFHFGIHLCRVENSQSVDWRFSLERLRPSDMSLNAPPLANQTVSLKNDREVNYYVQVTMMENKSPVIVNTGFISHVFTLGDQSSRRKEVVMTQLSFPFYVMFAICLPP